MFFTIWVTPEGRLAKLNPSRLFCFTAGFSGSPNGGAAKLSATLFDYVHGSGVSLRRVVMSTRPTAVHTDTRTARLTTAQDGILPHTAE
jgi:hypothetical protein